MRVTTGRVRARFLAMSLVAGAAGLALASAAAAAPPESSTTTTEASTTTSTTVPSSSTTTSTSSTTTSTSSPTTTSGPPAPGISAAGASGQLAERGSAFQLTPTLPPPPPPTYGLPASSGTGRRIVYSNSQMRIWAVEEDGTVVKTHRVSGKRYIPSPGTYYVYSRSLHTHAAHDPSIRWMYMVRFAYTPNGGRVGFHEIPTRCTASGCYRMQTEEQLGQPLSGGCVRQSTADAIWVWNWAPVGTKVVVLP